jgi:hypothetical protein
MATKSLKPSAELTKALVEALGLALKIEMANIPEDCRESAAASYLAAHRPLQVWVRILLDESEPAKAYDLRFGREAVAAK